VKNGVPIHVALGNPSDVPQRIQLDRLERMAMSIVYSEFEGGEFDFGSMSWKKPK
jgi:hypothetical protein